MLRSVVVSAGVLAFLAVGCTGGGDSDTDPDICANQLTPFPSANATDVYYRTTIEASLLEEDSTATISVNGGAVAGTSEWRDDRTLVFTPTDGLAASTAYSVSVSYGCGVSEWSFTTGEVGSTVAGDSLVGKTYALDMSTGRVVYPDVAGDLLLGYMTTDVLVGVSSIDGTEINVSGAISVKDSDPPEQDLCLSTIAFPTADFSSNPFFSIGPQQTTIVVQGYDVVIDELQVSGAFAPNMTYIAGAILAGNIDVRQIPPMLDDDMTADDICDLTGSLGAFCEACASDGQLYCLRLYVDSMTATELADTAIVEQNQEEACEHEECATQDECASDDTDVDTDSDTDSDTDA